MRTFRCVAVLRTIALLAVTAPAAVAQSLYIDFDLEGGPPTPPSSSYGAAVGVPGYWNAVHRGGPYHGQPLFDVDQQPVQAEFWTEGCDANTQNCACTTADDAALLNDWFYADCLAPPWTEEVRGLDAGTYQVYIYSPAGGTNGSLEIELSPSGTVEGSDQFTWPGHSLFPGSFVDWYVAVRILHIPNAGTSLKLKVNMFPGLSGIQLVRLVDTVPFCTGHLGRCPCGEGQVGAGCPSSFNPSGASLSGSGLIQVSNDTLQVSASGVLPTGLCILFQGTTAPGDGQGVLYGDGLRCAGGTLKRIGQRAAVGGVFQYPAAGDPPISVRGLVPSVGGFRTYQVQYRNPATYCNTDTFNATNGLAVLWSP